MNIDELQKILEWERLNQHEIREVLEMDYYHSKCSGFGIFLCYISGEILGAYIIDETLSEGWQFYGDYLEQDLYPEEEWYVEQCQKKISKILSQRAPEGQLSIEGI